MLISKINLLLLSFLILLSFSSAVLTQDIDPDKGALQIIESKDKTDTGAEKSEKKPEEKKDKAAADSGDKKDNEAADPGDKSKGGIKLGKIVVTPTKTGQKLGNSPASVTVIDSEDLKLSSGKHLDEALKSVSGVYLKRSKIGDTTTSIAIRGFKGSGSNLIMWNGMPLNDSYSSSPNWGSHSMNSTDSMEIVKGPFSSLYGKNAMGGVVNIITKTPEKQEIYLKTGYGSNNTYSGYSSYGDKYYDSLSVFLAYDYRSSDGIRNNLVTKEITTTGTTGTAVTGWEATTDPTGKKVYLIGDSGKNCWDQWVATGKLVWDISHDSKLGYSFKLSRYEYGYKDPQSYLKNSSTGYSVTSGSVTFNDGGTDYTTSVTNKTFLGSSGGGVNYGELNVLDYTLKAGLFDVAAKLGCNKTSNIYTTPGSSATFEGGQGTSNKTDPAMTLYGDMQVDGKIIEGVMLTVGYSMRHDHAEGDQWNIYDWKDADSEIPGSSNHFSEMEGSQLMNSVYTQVQYDLFNMKMLIFYAGARLDYWKNYDGMSKYNTTENNYSTTTDWHISPKASIVFKPGIELFLVKLESLKASAGSAFNPPNIYQLYKFWTSGSTEYNPNPDLKPETSWSYEAGGDISFINKIFIVSGTYFGSRIENQIYYKEIDSTHKIYNNAGKGKIHGYELEGKLYILDYFELYGNMTKTHTEVTENDTDPLSVGKQFTGVPELMYNAGLKVLYKHVDGSLNWRYCDHVYNNSQNLDTIEGVYTSYDTIKLLDLKVSVKPQDNVKFSLSVNNMLNREYYQYYLCEGRNFFWEAEIKI